MSAEEKDTLSLVNWNIQVPERGKISPRRVS